jgi:glutamate-1-semialdehyde 2,1-aminomutase|tara:strand:+ start:39 stop:1259 length:1221 start_codon:yes stop_codon:yes gene_type:complete
MTLFNEGYNKNSILFDKGRGSLVYSKKKVFIDLSCGAGTLFLGHNSEIFRKSIKKYLKFELSNFAHSNVSAVELSKNLKKIFSQFNKFVLCSTGAEANLKALRIARAATNKTIIINVSGSWHGSIDQLLYYTSKNNQAKKLSDGIDESLKKNLKYIPFNDKKKSIKILNKYKKKICCVLVEPIQGGFPTPEGIKYLKFLNNYCKKNKIILFFDEILTGIRVNCSSVQNTFKIRSEISTFGKIIGGGMPIGIIGISKNVLNKLARRRKKVFLGGTYSGNSLSTFVGNQTLKYILKNKKKIFSKVEKHSKLLQESLNNFINENNIDAKVIRFHSLMRIVFSKKNIKNRVQRDFFEKKKINQRENFIRYLKSVGIYFPGNGVISLSYSLTDDHVAYVIKKLNIGLKKFF